MARAGGQIGQRLEDKGPFRQPWVRNNQHLILKYEVIVEQEIQVNRPWPLRGRVDPALFRSPAYVAGVASETAASDNSNTR